MTERHLTCQFEDQLPAVGPRLAVRTPAGSLTYAQLDAGANGVADRLQALKAGVGTRVALVTDQDAGGCTALIGILKSGATCVPISQSEPPERIGHILADSGARVIITHAPYLDHATSVTPIGCQVLDLHDVSPVKKRTFSLPSNDALTFILYTSGSTGKPKGVIQKNTGSLLRARAWQAALDVTPQDRLTLFATFATGQGSSTTLLALLSGATLCPFKVRDEGIARLSSWLRSEQITIYVSSVTLLRSLVKHPDPEGDLPHLRVVRFGGERATPNDIDLARQRFPGTTLVHAYSSTETGNTAWYRVPDDVQFAPHEAVPVGPPSSGTFVHIVDDNGRDLPVGQIGEVVIRGPALSPGYWNDPARTADVFRPLTDAPDEPACRIGDLGRLRADGLLEHHGRKDFRVKIRGFRIELEEVEAAMARHPAVTRVSAVVRSQSNGEELSLVGYLETAAEPGLTPEVMRTYLAAQLPDHMIPSMFIFLDDLPLTPSGKVDRSALPDPFVAGPTLSHAHAEPRSPLETSIAQVWKDVLDLDVVGIHDHFLEVGGDSLRATQVAARLRDILKVDVPMRDLFDAGTVSELASVIERAQDQDTSTPDR